MTGFRDGHAPECLIIVFDNPTRPCTCGAAQRAVVPAFKAMRPGDQPLTKDDEGELQVKVACHPESKQIIVDFGKPVVWFGMPADDAEALANIILKNVAIARGETH